MAKWSTPETAPKDRPILADMGMPWACLAVWNEPAGQWCVTELEIGLFDGQWNDTYISHTYEPHSLMRGWMELPGVNRG